MHCNFFKCCCLKNYAYLGVLFWAWQAEDLSVFEAFCCILVRMYFCILFSTCKKLTKSFCVCMTLMIRMASRLDQRYQRADPWSFSGPLTMFLWSTKLCLKTTQFDNENANVSFFKCDELCVMFATDNEHEN